MTSTSRPYWFRQVNQLTNNGPLKELKVGTLPVCESCIKGKMEKRYFTAKGNRAKEQLELVHIDVCGPINAQARGGFEYFVTFMDDYSRYGHTYLLAKKSEAFRMFKDFKAQAEKQLGKSLKIL